MSDVVVASEYLNFEPQFSSSDPLSDYDKIMDEKMKPHIIVPHEIHQECWKKISAIARQTIWKMLFDDAPTNERLKKAAEFLKIVKEDAGFYGAFEYNKWIVEVRDELLKRNMLDFWRDEIVRNELGPCWARDSDLFDDDEDLEPVSFYNQAGCEAPWLKEEMDEEADYEQGLEEASALNDESLIDGAAEVDPESSPSDKVLRKLSPSTAIDDYHHNMDVQGLIDGDDDEAYSSIFAETRQMIWYYLFEEPTLSSSNYEKAAELLITYKKDAVFYNPFDYNDWIPKVRDELLKRKYFDFWQKVIVGNGLGLCWAGDSDFFDDIDDPKPREFFKIGEDFIKQQQEQQQQQQQQK